MGKLNKTIYVAEKSRFQMLRESYRAGERVQKQNT